MKDSKIMLHKVISINYGKIKIKIIFINRNNTVIDKKIKDVFKSFHELQSTSKILVQYTHFK